MEYKFEHKYKLYEVNYFYLASGMEGIPEEHYCGRVFAETEEDAKHKIARFSDTINLYRFTMSCLTAKEVA